MIKIGDAAVSEQKVVETNTISSPEKEEESNKEVEENFLNKIMEDINVDKKELIELIENIYCRDVGLKLHFREKRFFYLAVVR